MINSLGALVLKELRVFRRDLVPYVVLLIGPLILISFIRQLDAVSLHVSGHPNANGSELAVPGMAVTFAFLLVGNIGYGFFREHAWNTWNRLRMGPVHAPVILVGKLTVPFAAVVFELLYLFAIGTLVYGLDTAGSWGALVLVSVVLAACVLALAVALVGITSSVVQMTTLGNLGALILAGIGGALTPYRELPGWVQSIAPATPTYWAMRGYQDILLNRSGMDQVLPAVGVLCLFAIAFGLLAIWRFRFTEAKTGSI